MSLSLEKIERMSPDEMWSAMEEHAIRFHSSANDPEERAKCIADFDEVRARINFSLRAIVEEYRNSSLDK